MTTRVHAWTLASASGVCFSLHHAQRTYLLYVAPEDARRAGIAAVLLGITVGAVVARMLAPFAARAVSYALLVLAFAVLGGSFGPFVAFVHGPWARAVALGSVASVVAASVVAGALARHAVWAASLALGLLPYVLRPFALAAAVGTLVVVELGAARVGFLRSGASLAAALAAVGAVYPEIYTYLHHQRLPRLRVHDAFVLTSGLVAGACLLLAEALLPMHELTRFPDEVVFMDRAESDYAVAASPGGYELFTDGQLSVSSLDEPRRTRGLVLPVLRVAERARTVLLLHGGFGIVEREILEDPRVERLTVIASEARRSELARGIQFLSRRAEGALDSPRSVQVIAEPLVWLGHHHGERYDVVIADLPLPLGYRESKNYTRYAFKELAARLDEGGVLVVPGGSAFSAPEALAGVVATLDAAGLHATPYHVSVPSLGVTTYVVASARRVDPARLGEPGAELDLGLDLRPAGPGRVSTLSDQHIVTAFDTAVQHR